MDRRRAGLCLASALALAGCVTPEPPWKNRQVFADAIPLCALLADLKPHYGKRVLVRGYLTRGPHGRIFVDRGCGRGFIPVRPAPETARARRLRQLFSVYVDQFRGVPPLVPAAYSGVLKDHSPSLICDMLCEQFSLEEAELVALRRASVRDLPEPTTRGED